MATVRVAGGDAAVPDDDDDEIVLVAYHPPKAKRPATEQQQPKVEPVGSSGCAVQLQSTLPCHSVNGNGSMETGRFAGFPQVLPSAAGILGSYTTTPQEQQRGEVGLSTGLFGNQLVLHEGDLHCAFTDLMDATSAQGLHTTQATSALQAVCSCLEILTPQDLRSAIRDNGDTVNTCIKVTYCGKASVSGVYAIGGMPHLDAKVYMCPKHLHSRRTLICCCTLTQAHEYHMDSVIQAIDGMIVNAPIMSCNNLDKSPDLYFHVDLGG